ncbi:MAG: alpha-amylase family glycosyl hydrolase, partial [Methanococcaceae archaeon]
MQLKKSRKYYIFITWLVISLFFIPTLSSFGQKKASEVTHPAWSRNLTMYEVNLRQYTKGGTFREFEARLPELKKMGVGVLWFMPINPIGEKNRKGSLGSYYSVKDYMKVNPDYGTLEDFKSLVKKIHQSGMYVIIDWVANHTSWDNVLTVSHPEYFSKDSAGNFMPPVADWTDVIKLNYENKDLWKYMTGALTYWITETGIDGYRCDVASMVPTAFWNEARAELNKSKKVLMLAEAETPELHEKAFDMTYSWNLYHLMNDIAGAKKSAADLDAYFKKDREEYPKDSYRLTFTTNHDENSWNGTEFERLGNGVKAFEVLSFTAEGF